jgi:thioredoxin-related protein
VLAELQGLVKERGVAILDAGAESLDAHWGFRVHLLPTLVVIDKHGRVVRYLPGLRPSSEIRSAVEQAAAL